MSERLIHGGHKPGKRWRYAVWDNRYPDDVYYNTNRGAAADRLIVIAQQFGNNRVGFLDRAAFDYRHGWSVASQQKRVAALKENDRG